MEMREEGNSKGLEKEEKLRRHHFYVPESRASGVWSSWAAMLCLRDVSLYWLTHGPADSITDAVCILPPVVRVQNATWRRIIVPLRERKMAVGLSLDGSISRLTSVSWEVPDAGVGVTSARSGGKFGHEYFRAAHQMSPLRIWPHWRMYEFANDGWQSTADVFLQPTAGNIASHTSVYEKRSSWRNFLNMCRGYYP
jgi:hypothetical protein